MPFYEYECSNCRYYTEVLQKLSDAPLRKCPSCGRNTFKKLVSAPVFRLKGSGWYETDFKGDKDNKRNLAGAERDEPKAAEDKKDAKGSEPAKADAAPEKSAGSKDGEGKGGDGKSGSGKAAASKTSAATGRSARPRRAASAPKARAVAKPAKKKARR